MGPENIYFDDQEDLAEVVSEKFAKMSFMSTFVKVSLPRYLEGLPLPDSVLGWFHLSVGDWTRLLPFGVVVGGISYLSLKGLCATPTVGPVVQEKLNKVLPGFQAPRCNNKIKLDQPKAVDTVDVEDLGSKGVFCRCWKSNKFPYCDGSHNKHNAETGDNVGPLIIKKSD